MSNEFGENIQRHKRKRNSVSSSSKDSISDHTNHPPAVRCSSPVEEGCSHLLEGIEPSDLSFSFNTSVTHTTTEHSNTFYGLPLTVKDCFKTLRGIDKLYDWQERCLELSTGSNLIYSLPTSGGKTLVAEILILKQILLKKKDVLFILPYVSIVQEKVRELLPFAETLRFAVEEYAASKGRLPPIKKRNKNSIYIATIEKANALINSLIELKRLSHIGLIVIDELHMIGEERGPVLEGTLSKILYISASGGGDTQLIGMSATINNLNELTQFMKAQLFTDDFRPVQLIEYIKMGQSLYTYTLNSEGMAQLVFDKSLSSTHDKADPDQLTSLVLEVLPLSCLVFCATKKNCENVAIMLTKTLPESVKLYKKEERNSLIKLLRIEVSGLCPILVQTLPFGIAYHHSGLTTDERRLIEHYYLTGTLNIITCTSTLAAGVNLPAKRVIIRQPYIGSAFITKNRYKQMIGRAGRSGLSESGESIVIIQPKDKPNLMSLLSSPCESCSSSLLKEDHLKSLLLSIISLKIIQSREELMSFLQCTLLYYQTDNSLIEATCDEQLTHLSSQELIVINDQYFTVTDMGRATHKGCLNVSNVHMIYDELLSALKNLVLTTDLHLLVLSVPEQLIDNVTPNWRVFFEKVSSLCPDDMHVASLMNINIGILARKLTGSYNKMSNIDLIRYRRFYIGLMLYSLIKSNSSESVWNIADTFHTSRGFIQTLLQQSCSYCSCLVHFTEELPQLWPYKLLLPSIVQKLSYSASTDLIPLMEIQGMKQGRARQLLNVGIKTPCDLIKYTPSELSKQVDHLYVGQAGKLIKAATLLLTEKVELLQDEAHELTELLPAHNIT